MVSARKPKRTRATRVLLRAAVKQPQKKKNEITRLGAALRGLGGMGGGALGSLIGMGGAGSLAGNSMGAAISRWLGSGDYEVHGNSIINNFKSSGEIPMMHNNGQSIIVRHKEYVCDVIGGAGAPSAFNIFRSFPLNPGLSSSFPWLATVAQNYVEYTWKGVVYHYVPTSGHSVASGNTAMGSVMMATNYRSTASAYTSKQIMLNEFFASDARPSEGFAHPIECDPRENPYNVQYVRTGAVPTGEDQKTYDLGVMSIGSQGLPAAALNCGELWVTYEVELRKPKAVGTYSLNADWLSAEMTGVNYASAHFGTGNSQVGTLTAVMSLDTITFSKGMVGAYIMMMIYPMANVTANGIITAVGTNCTVTDVLAPAGSTITNPSGDSVTSVFFYVTDANVQALITTAGTPLAGATPGFGSLLVFERNSASTASAHNIAAPY